MDKEKNPKSSDTHKMETPEEPPRVIFYHHPNLQGFLVSLYVMLYLWPESTHAISYLPLYITTRKAYMNGFVRR